MNFEILSLQVNCKFRPSVAEKNQEINPPVTEKKNLLFHQLGSEKSQITAIFHAFNKP